MNLNRVWLLFVINCLLLALPVQAAEGLITLRSPHSVQETMARLETSILAHDLRIFLQLDHAAGAASVGRSLRPTQLFIFGNPQGGTAFMACNQTAGIDLPLKALIWEDEAGEVWLGYNDPAYLATRQEVEDCPVISVMQELLAGIAGETTALNQPARP